ncbi:hypothetical protein SO802_015210 [Lithocarpus litseifolius]|uniref:Reverse transcriptase zinc-binding domain-containing protein n=1 Tax=Lithocarpus litseifolius TaxID=425828 RepID=A0AAW2CUB9_9ROSI
MLAKQYWRITQNSNSLLARTFKAKYFPRGSVQECKTKPHHSWIWKNIIKSDNPKLREGIWWVGRGFDIPLNHQHWFAQQHIQLNHPNLVTGTVGDLIDHSSHSWKCDLVRSLYTLAQASKILQISLSRTDAVQDKLCWKYSNEGHYEVKSAYQILVKDNSVTQGPTLQQKGAWNQIWSVKVPLKLNIFVWKLMRDRLQTMLSLFNRGISSLNLCPLCNEESESTTHLFLLCPFTRACWHGSGLAIHSYDFNSITVQQWLTSLLLKHKKKEVHSMEYLQAVFTYLWSIWTYRNRVVHEGIVPNPMEVILTAKLYLAGARCNRTKRYSFAYEAINMQGVSVFFGVACSIARSKGGAMFEAMVEATIRAKQHGFQYVLFLGDDRRVVQAFRKKRSTDWLDKTRLADLNALAQSGFFL